MTSRFSCERKTIGPVFRRWQSARHCRNICTSTHKILGPERARHLLIPCNCTQHCKGSRSNEHPAWVASSTCVMGPQLQAQIDGAYSDKDTSCHALSCMHALASNTVRKLAHAEDQSYPLNFLQNLFWFTGAVDMVLFPSKYSGPHEESTHDSALQASSSSDTSTK